MDDLKKTNSKINYYAVVLVLIMIAIPVAYSATEPSIIINMENTQTQKPFIIKDNLGAEVFSVDVDGTVFPSSAPPVQAVPLVFTFQSDNAVAVIMNSGETELNPQLLLQVDTTNPDLSAVNFIRAGHTIIINEGKRDSGSGNCQIGWVRSTNGGTTYTDIGSEQSTSSASFTSMTDTSTFLILEDNTTNFGLGIYSSDGSTTCTFQNIVAFTEFYFVEGWTINQVIP